MYWTDSNTLPTKVGMSGGIFFQLFFAFFGEGIIAPQPALGVGFPRAFDQLLVFNAMEQGVDQSFAVGEDMGRRGAEEFGEFVGVTSIGCEQRDDR